MKHRDEPQAPFFAWTQRAERFVRFGAGLAVVVALIACAAIAQAQTQTQTQTQTPETTGEPTWWLPQPASTHADAIVPLFNVVLILTGAVLVQQLRSSDRLYGWKTPTKCGGFVSWGCTGTFELQH